MSKDLLSILLEGAGAILKPLRQALEDPQALDNLLESLGADAEIVGEADFLEGLRAVSQAMQRLDELRAEPSLSLETVGAGLAALNEAFTAARFLGSSGAAAY